MNDWPEIQRLPLTLHRDPRGMLHEVWRQENLHVRLGLKDPMIFAQATYSESVQGVLRGIHYQPGTAQGKLIQVIAGEIWDLTLDMRRHSPRLGRWQGLTLGAETPELLWVPPGFGHGFYVTGSEAKLLYYATAAWQPSQEQCIAWNDPDLAIAWPLAAGQTPQISPRDAAGQSFINAPRHG